MKNYNTFTSNIKYISLNKDIKNLISNYNLLKITENKIYQKLDIKYISSGQRIICSFMIFNNNNLYRDSLLFNIGFNKNNIDIKFKTINHIYLDLDENTYKIILEKIKDYLDYIESSNMDILLEMINLKLPILNYNKFKIKLDSYSKSIDYHKIILKCFENNLLDDEMKNKYQYILNARNFDLL